MEVNIFKNGKVTIKGLDVSDLSRILDYTKDGMAAYESKISDKTSLMYEIVSEWQGEIQDFQIELRKLNDTDSYIKAKLKLNI